MPRDSRKTAMVTGGAHRVGKAISLTLAQMGYNVVINYYSSEDEAQATVREAEAHGVEAVALQADVSDYDAASSMCVKALDRFGTIDVLVNSASLFDKIDFPTDDIATWQRVTRISIDGAFYVSNALAPAMLAQESGTIINIVDLSAWIPWPRFTAHAVGKSGLLGLTRQLALELAPHVRVNAIAPGPVLPPPNHTEQHLREVEARTLLARWGSPDDVTRAVRYLVEADYVTGDVLTVDGGERFGHAKMFGGKRQD